MKFFVDANVILYSAVAGPHHPVCLNVLRMIAAGKAEGQASTAVLEEVWHLELSGKAGPIQGLTGHAYAIFAPLLPVTDDAFQVALSILGSRLGTNDRLHVGTCIANGIATVLTADAAFDGVAGLSRVDPGNRQAMARLLA